MESIILLSSGLDSTVNLAIAKQEINVLLAITFDYGQKSSKQEIKCSQEICKHYNIPHKVVELDFFKKEKWSALLNHKSKIPKLVLQDLNSISATTKSRDAVWVPNRNGVFLNIAGAFAEAIDAQIIITGFNFEEAQTFPDNSQEFIEIANNFFSHSTLKKVKVKSYTIEFNKKEILELAIRLEVPLSLIWVCYENKKKMCGKCESCLRLKRAIQELNYKPDKLPFNIK